MIKHPNNTRTRTNIQHNSKAKQKTKGERERGRARCRFRSTDVPFCSNMRDVVRNARVLDAKVATLS